MRDIENVAGLGEAGPGSTTPATNAEYVGDKPRPTAMSWVERVVPNALGLNERLEVKPLHLETAATVAYFLIGSSL
jgi:hypothetical protein